ncbi:hypothetical protein QUA32_03645 [Microcoleus sp. Pol14D6]|uniref:hypothetical protein n=1 Tax=unclassified Microcoleus TaxID=2642155 RepID=UPI002FD3BB16
MERFSQDRCCQLSKKWSSVTDFLTDVTDGSSATDFLTDVTDGTNRRPGKCN